MAPVIVRPLQSEPLLTYNVLESYTVLFSCVMQLVNGNTKQLRELCTKGQLTVFRAFPFRFIIIIITIIINSFRKYVSNIPGTH